MSIKKLNKMGFPEKYGLYDSDNEHENCGFGFIANIKNEPKHEIVHQALEIVHNLDHRGAIGADPLAGDGAGILIQIPHDFFKEEFLKTDIKLPEIGNYGVGMIFLPPEKNRASSAIKSVEEAIKKEGQSLIGWRDVPVDDSVLGETVKIMRQSLGNFYSKRKKHKTEKEFQRKLYVIRKQSLFLLQQELQDDCDDFILFHFNKNDNI